MKDLAFALVFAVAVAVCCCCLLLLLLLLLLLRLRLPLLLPFDRNQPQPQAPSPASLHSLAQDDKTFMDFARFAFAALYSGIGTIEIQPVFSLPSPPGGLTMSALRQPSNSTLFHPAFYSDVCEQRYV